MASATETALLALKAALDTLAGGRLPTEVLRNEDLAARLADMTDTLKGYANLWDGAQVEREEFLGAGIAGATALAYGITHEARLELAFVGGENDERDLAYDNALIAVNDLLLGDVTIGGTVDFAEIGELEFQGSGLITDGIPHAKGVIVPITLTFRSSRPF